MKRGDNMIAEIKGKISSSGSNLNDRLEDNLTGNVFGALRYIPFDLAMKQILVNAIYPRSLGTYIQRVQADFWNNNIEFWPYDEEGELDAIIDFEDILIGIEVKFLSGLSSDDSMDFSETSKETSIEDEKNKSQHQLSRESRIISKKGNNKKKLLIFIANSSTCSYVYEDTIKRELIESDVELGYITWQSFFHELTKLKLDNEFHNLVIEDLIKLLKRKGLDQFRDMNLDEDYIVDDLGFYQFNGEVNNEILNNKLKSTINFNIDTQVRGDLYYGFKGKC